MSEIDRYQPPTEPLAPVPSLDREVFTPEIVEFTPDMVQSEGGWKEKTIKVAGGVVVVAALGTYGFELSWLNETWRVDEGTKEIMLGGSAVDVAIVVTKITTVVEVVSGSLIALGLNMKNDTTRKLKERFQTKKDELLEGVSEDELPKEKTRLGALATDAGLALGAGAGIVVGKDHFSRENPSLIADMGSMAKGAAVVIPVSGLTGYLVGGGINHTEDTPLEKPAEWFVDYALDTRFMFAALTLGYAYKYRRQLPAILEHAGQQISAPFKAIAKKFRKSDEVNNEPEY